ncbi:MAG: hypothetical protein B7X76_08640 [Azorhizobium sp. 39-67-5]|nr:MAG: hypothetical protein B7X76_08640 [Azorhizobium sp. 39-67-5]
MSDTENGPPPAPKKKGLWSRLTGGWGSEADTPAHQTPEAPKAEPASVSPQPDAPEGTEPTAPEASVGDVQAVPDLAADARPEGDASTLRDDAAEEGQEDRQVEEGRVEEKQVSDGQVSDGQVSDGQVSDGQVEDGRAEEHRAAEAAVSDALAEHSPAQHPDAEAPDALALAAQDDPVRAPLALTVPAEDQPIPAAAPSDPEQTEASFAEASFAETSSAEEPEPAKTSFWRRLTSGLARTASSLTQGITDLVSKRKLDAETLEELEDILIRADLGTATAARIVEAVGRGRHDKMIGADEVKGLIAAEVESILASVAKPLVIDDAQKPFIILMVGVNGSGKTTTIGKLAAQWKSEGRKVVLAAGDTFRAAAIEQLKVWGAGGTTR